MDYKTFVKQQFQKHKNSGLSAPEIMKQIGAEWQKVKGGHGEKPAKKSPKTKVKGGGMSSSVPLSSMRSVFVSRPEPTFLVTNGAIHGSGFWSDLSDGFKSVISTVAPVLALLL